MATALEAPKETKPEAPQETLFTILLHPAPMNNLFTSTPSSICILSQLRQRAARFSGDGDDGWEEEREMGQLVLVGVSAQ